MNHTNRCLIITHGFFGDILFASSIAKKLKDENQFGIVDYLIGFPQMKRLMENNPYIDSVFVSERTSPSPVNSNISFSSYDKIVELRPLSFVEPPPIEFQKYAGVLNPDTYYTTYTEKEYDDFAKNDINNRFGNDKKTIAIMRNWKPKTYLFTEEQYEIGIDVPNLGYGGSHRDIEFVIDGLSKYFNIVYVGVDSNVNQFDTQFIPDDVEGSLLYDCSIIKSCSAFIGAEGGLANLAAGAGVRTIITGDFVHQLYGPNGVLRKIKEPKLGPKYYFPEFGHVTLNPYISDDQIINSIKELLNE